MCIYPCPNNVIPMFSHFKYMLCYSVIAGAQPTPMDTSSEGDINSKEESREMKKAAKEEKRLETEYKEGVKVKGETKSMPKQPEGKIQSVPTSVGTLKGSVCINT